MKSFELYLKGFNLITMVTQPKKKLCPIHFPTKLQLVKYRIRNVIRFNEQMFLIGVVNLGKIFYAWYDIIFIPWASR